MTGRPTCQYCGARLRWVETDRGNRMPLDPDPNPDGSVVMRQGIAHVLKASERPENVAAEHWMPHAASCSGRPRKARRR